MRVKLGQQLSRFLTPLFHHQPAGTFRDPQDQQHIYQRRNRFDPQHPAPRLYSSNLADQIVGQEGHQNAKNDHELVLCDQATALAGGRDLGDVDGRRYRGGTDTEAADKPEKGEHARTGCQSGTQCRDEVQDPDPKQGLLSAQRVTRDTAKQGADHGPPQCHGHDKCTVEPVAGLPQCLDGLICTGNDNRIKSEQKTGKCDDQRPAKNAVVHCVYPAMMSKI